MIRGKGSPFGPELSNIGTVRSAAAIRRSILEPDAEIADGFDGARLKLKSGSSIEGVVRNEDNFSIQLIDRDGRFYMLEKEAITAVARLEKKSLMPGNIAGELTQEEFQDLLAFLDRQRRPEESPEQSR
jgi:putative heme-binding domain-containing protein